MKSKLAFFACILGMQLSFTTLHSQTIQDNGDFLLIADAPGEGFENAYHLLADRSRIIDMLNDLNSFLALPYNINIHFQDNEGPYYYQGNIMMNYGFLNHVYSVFNEAGYIETQEDLDMILDVVEFVLYHEIGHALVEAYAIPITGKEEDAVDGLASVLISEVLEDPEMALVVADLFALQDEQVEEFEEAHFWDEHSLDAQRYYNILCWFYGSNPEQYQSVIEEEGLAQQRAVRCPGEYQQLFNSWGRLLAPYIKE
ncbi:MAG: hypothetical protein KDC24_06595 [Saprospiraceae bacterium]|nr:hypothetical protein [Saprospiraceae bacterium]